MKEHTIIFVPHARAKFRKWRFSSLQAWTFIGILTTLTLGGLIATALYFQTSFDRNQLVEIERENAELRQVNQNFEHSIATLSSTLEEYQQQIQKLAIVAGVAELSPTAGGGIGGPLAIDPAAGNDGLVDHLGLLEDRVDILGHGMRELEKRFDQRRLMISSTPAITPVKGLLTSRHGYRKDPFTKRRTFHGGIDIVAPRGKEVRAPGDGVVIKTGYLQGLGKAVYVSHGYGLTTRYGHLSKIAVKEGDKLERGDLIGNVGNSGRSTGYHLHYEVRVDGKPVDPLGYILDSTAP